MGYSNKQNNCVDQPTFKVCNGWSKGSCWLRISQQQQHLGSPALSRAEEQRELLAVDKPAAAAALGSSRSEQDCVEQRELLAVDKPAAAALGSSRSEQDCVEQRELLAEDKPAAAAAAPGCARSERECGAKGAAGSE